MLRPRRRGRVGRRRSRPEEVPDMLHPLLCLRLRRTRHDETRRVAIDREREVVRPENRKAICNSLSQGSSITFPT